MINDIEKQFNENNRRWKVFLLFSKEEKKLLSYVPNCVLLQHSLQLAAERAGQKPVES